MPRTVISALGPDGTEAIGPQVLLWHVPHNDIFNGSLLTVETKPLRGAEGARRGDQRLRHGPVSGADRRRSLVGGVQQAFFSGQSPWQYEVLYINRSKLVIRAEGSAMSREMVEIRYAVSYYIHIETKEDCLTLIQHMPVAGHHITSDEVGPYVWPIIEQDLNHFIQIPAVHEINEKISDITQLIGQQVQTALRLYGITLDDVRVVTQPVPNLITERIGFMQPGLDLEGAFRFGLAQTLAARSVVSAPNAAVGAPYQIGGVQPVAPVADVEPPRAS